MQIIKSTKTLTESALRSIAANSIDKCRCIDGADKVDIRYSTNHLSNFIGDANQVAMVLDCLIANGIKHRCDKTTQSYVDVFIASTPQKISIKVLDNGVGMDSEKLDQIKQTLSNKFNKKLGLYIVNEIVQNVKGSFFVESVKDSGTMVMVDLPNTVSNKQNNSNPYELNNNN